MEGEAIIIKFTVIHGVHQKHLARDRAQCPCRPDSGNSGVIAGRSRCSGTILGIRCPGGGGGPIGGPACWASAQLWAPASDVIEGDERHATPGIGRGFEETHVLGPTG